jgi:hypothetical protein
MYMSHSPAKPTLNQSYGSYTGRWQQAFKKNLQLTYEIFNFVRNSI